MISIAEILALVSFAAGAWLWLDSLKAREIAVRAARDACAADGCLLLDDTVAIAALRPARNDAGHLTLERAYDFEYSDTGNNRLPGGIVLRGHRVVMLNVGTRGGGNVYTLH
jgi:hypothetical protein